MSLFSLVVGVLSATGATAQEPGACDVVDMVSAEVVLGSGAIDLGGEAAAEVCRYDNADRNLILMVQIFDAVMYDVMPITPETPVEIGDRGRYGVGSSGSANVQFVKGDRSVTMRVSPIGGPSAEDLMEPMLEIARIAAGRM